MKKYFIFWLLFIMSPCLVFAHGLQRPLPKDLHSVSEKAEDLIGLYLKNDWAGAQAAVDSISQDEASVIKAVKENKMGDSAADVFSYLVFRSRELSHAKGNPIEAALVANQMTSQLIDLQGFYAHTTPLEIARMDYLGREIVLLAEVPDDFGLLDRRVAQLEQTWNHVKPVVIKQNGDKAAAEVDQVISAIKQKPSHQQLVKEANRILDLVDTLEGLFNKKIRP